MRSETAVLMALAAATALLEIGCAPQIGDPCATTYGCSVSGSRVCDLAEPHGYCTIYGCESGTCPNNAVCVRWRPEPSRLTFTACMRHCGHDSDCRVDQGYKCVHEVTMTPSGGPPITEVVDVDRVDTAKFCVAFVPE